MLDEVHKFSIWYQIYQVLYYLVDCQSQVTSIPGPYLAL